MNLPAIFFGWILASIIGFLFHLIRGGPLRRIVLNLVTAWIGFGVGQLLGSLTGTTLVRLGAINLFSATLGAIIALVLFDVLSPQAQGRSEQSGRPGRFGPG